MLRSQGWWIRLELTHCLLYGTFGIFTMSARYYLGGYLFEEVRVAKWEDRDSDISKVDLES